MRVTARNREVKIKSAEAATFIHPDTPVNVYGHIDKQNNLNIFPNPVSGQLYIIGASVDENLTFIISDLAGRIMMEKNHRFGFDSPELSIDVSTLSTGVYIVSWRGQTRMGAFKIIRE